MSVTALMDLIKETSEVFKSVREYDTPLNQEPNPDIHNTSGDDISQWPHQNLKERLDESSVEVTKNLTDSIQKQSSVKSNNTSSQDNRVITYLQSCVDNIHAESPPDSGIISNQPYVVTTQSFGVDNKYHVDF